eukprot:TRINITY_DN11615_c0_g1_i1.p1 TRINITY_DN11615_c0_g1~~TRINITY_DN11615_c0_g1_i1.p1  ORF type:complete len:229 (+),score=34.92 TRINITY_DN11615_c0_g1_i1:121-807(+)
MMIFLSSSSLSSVSSILVMLLLVVGGFVGLSSCAFGIDVSQAVSQSDFNCMKPSLEFVVMRCYRSVGSVDPDCAGTVHAAHAASIPDVSVYIFPCFKCGNPTGQMQTMVSHMKTNNINVSMIWLDIEGPGTYWGSNQATNENFIDQLAKEGTSLGYKLGVYTSASQWIPIVGKWTGLSNLPLWYAHYNNQQNFDDFTPFGGWTKPSIKQYADGPGLCGADGADRNWRP